MQGLVYIFIALAALGIAAAAYFGLTFTPIEALVTAMAFGALAVMIVERGLRQRSEARLERAIGDLARLLSTDAQAGQVLSQRINQLADTNAGNRLDGIEADISVLGTVVRQVAETVAEMEEARRREAAPPVATPVAATPAAPETVLDDHIEPVIPLHMLQQAVEENRLTSHIEPIIVLPQRKPFGYDLVPRLQLDDGDFADAADFMPRNADDPVIQKIEARALDEAIVIARRARTAGQPIKLFVPLSRASFTDRRHADELFATLEANRAIAESLTFTVRQGEWKQLMPSDKGLLAQIANRGISFSLGNTSSLRFDFGELQGLGFNTARFDATRFLRDPESFTDFHTSDIAAYAKRFDMALMATGVIDEQQLLALFEDGILLMQGPHIGRPGPARADLVLEREAKRVGA